MKIRYTLKAAARIGVQYFLEKYIKDFFFIIQNIRNWSPVYFCDLAHGLVYILKSITFGYYPRYKCLPPMSLAKKCSVCTRQGKLICETKRKMVCEWSIQWSTSQPSNRPTDISTLKSPEMYRLAGRHPKIKVLPAEYTRTHTHILYIHHVARISLLVYMFNVILLQ